MGEHVISWENLGGDDVSVQDKRWGRINPPTKKKKIGRKKEKEKR